MEKNNELNNKDLNSVSGGNSNLDKYLKKIVGEDKSKILVDYGTGKTLKLNPSLDIDDDDNVYIIKRERKDSEIEAELNILNND